MSYARLLWWEVENFMCYSHAKVEFDEKNVINFKGYNDSGKSAMLQALNVLMFNSNASKQINFIKDDADYFRIMAYFEDGVLILRDKYINGQSLYEMYKDNTLVFSTKQGKTLTRVSGVPEPIEEYLGLLNNDTACLNSRSCIEKQFLVQTTGSENYKLLNVILKSEELAIASQMLNDDKNKLAGDINRVDSKLLSTKELVRETKDLTEDLLIELEKRDSNFEKKEKQVVKLEEYVRLSKENKNLQIPPKLDNVVKEQLLKAKELQRVKQEKDSVNILPLLKAMDEKKLKYLKELNTLYKDIKDMRIVPVIQGVEMQEVEKLKTLRVSLDQKNTIANIIKGTEDMLEQERKILLQLNEKLKEVSAKYNICPNCGYVYEK